MQNYHDIATEPVVLKYYCYTNCRKQEHLFQECFFLISDFLRCAFVGPVLFKLNAESIFDFWLKKAGIEGKYTVNRGAALPIIKNFVFLDV